MKRIKVQIKKLYADSILPTKAHTTDAGYDMYAHSKSYDEYGNVVYRLGVATLIPEGYAGFIFPRSSNAKQDLTLTNSVGVVDAGFTGEISVKFAPVSRFIANGNVIHPFRANSYEIGDRVCQLVVMPIPDVEFEEVDEFPQTARGTGSYGSTGK